MPDHFSIRDATPCTAVAGNIVTTTSDVPAHLWMRWTQVPPRIHKKPVLRRGMWLNDDVRFCFDVYQDIEQDQPGDTLTHTFTRAPCLQGRHWWYYIWGYIAGIISPSTTPVLEYDCTLPCPEPPEPIRYAWSRQFGASGSLRWQSTGTGLAGTFQVTATPTISVQLYLFTQNNDDVPVQVRLYAIDENDKPTGFYLVTADLNLQDGEVLQDSTPQQHVYRHTAPLAYTYTPSTRYAYVCMTIAGTAKWWLRFRGLSWEGPRDDGQENHVTLHRTADAGETWVYAPPGIQCYEAWGTQ